jgi:hypothetical protein
VTDSDALDFSGPERDGPPAYPRLAVDGGARRASAMAQGLRDAAGLAEDARERMMDRSSFVAASSSLVIDAPRQRCSRQI